MKKNTEIFKKEVFDLEGKEYTVLGEYIDSATKIKVKHNKCGFEYNVVPAIFLSGKRCPKCAGNIRKDTEQFKQEVFDLIGDEYTVLDEYKNALTKIKIKHNKCGYEYEVTPASFLSGRRCPKCAGTMKKNTELFTQEVFVLVGDEYSVLGKYINNRIKIKMLHKKCGYEYEVVPDAFLRGNRCPKCSGKLRKRK